MYKQAYGFIEKYSVIYLQQFGFRSIHSTTHALIHITEKMKSCGIFIDLQKAFDTVNPEILLHKLNYYGFRGVVNDWFRSYLHERKQKVCINGYDSDLKTLQHGVPQGSVFERIIKNYKKRLT